MSGKCCGDCRYCFPITRDGAEKIVGSISRQARLRHVRSDVTKAVLWAVSKCGICAWRTEIVGRYDEGCDEHWRDGHGE